jgi:lactate 2-monooxygenase
MNRRDDFGRNRQSTVCLRGVAGRKPLVPVDARLLEERARGAMSTEAFAYIAGGAGRESTMDVLPGIVAAVDGKIPVLFDSGVRGGADVFKALALGASAVCVGRPYTYGLALAGEKDVREVIQNIWAEFDLTLGLSGCTSTADLESDRLSRVTT